MRNQPTASANRSYNPSNSTGSSSNNTYGGTTHNNNSSYQQQQQNNTNSNYARPQFSVNIWLLRNTLPVVPSSGYPIECAEPGDLLYGCENDLLDAGTKPLTWGPQPSLQHVLNPRYFTGEALSALLIVRNTSATATAKNCKVRLELYESAQRKTSELLSQTIPSLAANGQSEFRIFTRIVEPGIYSLNAKVSCNTTTTGASGFPASSPTTDLYASPSRNNNHDPNNSNMNAPGFDSNLNSTVVSATKSISVECDKGIEEASRRIIQLPGKKGPGSVQFLVMYCLRNASKTNPAALQHVSLVSKDPAVTVSLKTPSTTSQNSLINSSKELLNSADIHMTDLLRVPVTTGSSSTDCIDSVMQAGEMRQFCWIVDVVASVPNANNNEDDSTKKASSLSVSAAAALALLTNSSPTSSSATKNSAGTNINTINQAQINIGVVEWQWRRAGGDGGAIRSSIITTTLTAPSSARGELAVESTGVQPSPVVVGEPCELTYRITNRSLVPVDINAHVEPSNLLPDFLFVGGSTCIPLGSVEPRESVELRIPVMPIQSGVFTAEAAFQLRDASPPNFLPLWSGNRSSGINNNNANNNNNNNTTQTNVVCMQAT